MPKIKAPEMVYVSGEEMTRYTMQLILDRWINPNFDTAKWQFFDLSCKNRDKTDDQVLKDVVAAGKKIGSIFKEPTITPTKDQAKEMGLKKAWGSPNGAMRRGWNGISISRDTIHIEGVPLGYKKKVLFDRQAVGGEYGAGFKEVGTGKSKTFFYPKDGGEPVLVDERELPDVRNSVVTYHNPLDNLVQLAEHFFGRCLEANATPYIVTKKTVFKWQEPFWEVMKEIFDRDWKKKFTEKKLLGKSGNLEHLISDAATMKLITWKDGGFGMVAHNYDGDMLTDEMSQVHGSPGFITSNLVGKREDGVMIKEFEASHGTVADMDQARLRGEETSLNPLGMVDALLSAMEHSAKLYGGEKEIFGFTDKVRKSMFGLFASGKGTRDLSGPKGLTTEQFIASVANGIEVI